MGEERLSDWKRRLGMVPAPLAARNYRLGDILVRDTRNRCLIPIGDMESWASDDCKEYAASLLRDIHTAWAAWSTDEFMKRVQEEVSSMPVTPGIYGGNSYNGEAVKVDLSFNGYQYMTAYKKKSFAALVSWLAKPRASSTKASQRTLHALYHHGLDRGWNPLDWKLDRQKAIPGEGTWGLPNTIYIITDMLVASAVSTKQHCDNSASASVSPLSEAAPANGGPVPTHTPELNRDDNQASTTDAPKVVGYRVIGAEYDPVTGKLKHLCLLHNPHQYDSLARDTKPDAPPPLVEAETRPSDMQATATEDT